MVLPLIKGKIREKVAQCYTESAANAATGSGLVEPVGRVLTRRSASVMRDAVAPSQESNHPIA
ncbi:MAG: hypothetical protein Q8L65_14935, partial [Burkholderiales bacterium]|nr:hypothetical protein [Burkholderiales bacterium]